TSTPSSSGRRLWPPAPTAAKAAFLTTNGYRPGPQSRADLSVEAARRPRPKGGGAVRFSGFFWRFPWLRPLLLLTPPLAWFVVVYFASLVLLLVTAFWTTNPFTTQSMQFVGLPPANIGYTNIAMWIVFSYIWLPFMIIPTYAALERVPESLIEAATDLGARRWQTVRDVVLPLALPGVVAGSIFTFSL